MKVQIAKFSGGIMVKKAVVLAAGLGTRLRPLTSVTPKPLMPVWGEPMLARIVALLRGWGVEDIVVNCHYLHEQIEDWCAANGCRASYEPEILGTGGVLNPLRAWIGADDFYLVNADIVVDGLDRAPFAEAPRTLRNAGVSVIAQCVVTEEGPRTIELEPDDGLVTCWKSPTPGWSGTYTYGGLARLTAAILDYVEPSGFSSIVQAYEKAMMDGKFVRGVRPANLLWTDAGTVTSYIELNQDGADNAFADLPQVKAALAACGAENGPQTHADGSPQSADDAAIEFLGARGSDRVFFRAGERIIILYDDARRGENAKYAGHARWLKAHGIDVPEILADLPAMKAIVMANAGATDLKGRLAERGVKALTAYAPVVALLARFNALGAAAAAELELEPAFDAGLWRWERDLFTAHCLGTHFRREMPTAVRRELEDVAALLEKEPRTLVHRDFQSTNILFKTGRMALIDFQGMRLGPAAYDLASLLYDPYVTLMDEDRFALATLYGQKAGRPDIVKVLPVAAVQRLVQALGAYGRLASVGQPQFGRYVLPALENLLAAADDAGLDALGALAEELIAAETHAHPHPQAPAGG
ncbi:MAG: phosphotransferase [Kiritimatiellia bacterium]